MALEMRQLLNAAQAVHRHRWLGYGLGALLLLIASLMLFLFIIEDVLPPGMPFLTLLPAVLLTTFFAGLGPGIAVAVVAGVTIWYWFLPPYGSIAITGSTVVALLFYGGTVAVMVAFVQSLNIVFQQLRREQAHAAELYDQQRVMFQELQHRVANNMTFVAGLLSLYRRKAENDPASAIAALDEARLRLETIARIHRRLYDPASVNLPVGQYLQELSTDLLETSGAKNIVCLVDAPAMSLDVRRLHTLSLIVTELITNSVKHAFAEDQTGTIAIALNRSDPDHLELTIRDNGKGLPADFDPASSKSLGVRIVQGLAAQLRGEISYATENGTVARVVFPS